MNKPRKLEKIISVCIILVIMVTAGLVFAFCPPVAYFNTEFYVTGTTKELDLCGSPTDWPLYYLQFFGNLKKLHLYGASESDLQYIPKTKTLTDISMSFTDIKEPSAVKSFDTINTLSFYGSRFSFDGFASDKIKTLTFDSCDIDDLDKHGIFSSLEELSFNNCYFDSEDFSYTNAMYRTDDQIIKDSSGFAGLATVKKLSFDHLIFEDINGFLNMSSLKEIVAPENAFSSENIDKLANAGIKVSEPK
jgi:hypothetical protein